jgi:GH15 family glucan-1,4-alpha-glucosidase
VTISHLPGGDPGPVAKARTAAQDVPRIEGETLWALTWGIVAGAGGWPDLAASTRHEHRRAAGYLPVSEQARLAFEEMLTYANHLDLCAEQIGRTGERQGNFPQALTHLALISAAFNLDRALG